MNDIFDYLSGQQVSAIIDAINRGCLYRQNKNRRRKNPYLPMRTSHQLTADVLYEFAPDVMTISGLTSTTIFYGANNGWTQPEISGEKVLLHIYSSGAALNNEVIKKNCRKYNETSEPPVFFAFQFRASKDYQLESVNVIHFDCNGNIVEKQQVYRPQLKLAITG